MLILYMLIDLITGKLTITDSLGNLEIDLDEITVGLKEGDAVADLVRTTSKICGIRNCGVTGIVRNFIQMRLRQYVFFAV